MTFAQPFQQTHCLAVLLFTFNEEAIMMKRKIVKQMFGVAAFAMMFGAHAVYAQQTQPAEKSGSAASAKGGDAVGKKDQKTMREMAQSNLAEIEAGKLALSKSQNDDVKKFAEKMVDDHTKSQKELEQLAQSKGVTLPTEPDSRHQKVAKKLSGLSGDDFDRVYMQQGGVEDHKKTHRLLKSAQSGAKDADLKALAQKTEPVVQEHLTMAQQLHAAKGDMNKSTSTADNRAKSAPSASGGSESGSSSAGAPSK
jgi:putative membrane protein